MKKHLNLFRPVGILFAAVLFCAAARAADIVWTNSSSGNWGTAANWNPNQVPGSADNAFITNNGTYAVTLNAAATLASFTLGGASGVQTFTNASQTLTLNGASVVNGNGVFGLSGGTLTGAGDLTVNGTFNWTGGTMSGGGVTFANGGLTMSGTGTKSLSGRTLVNTATATWSAGVLYTGLGSVLSNAPSGTFDISFDATENNLGGTRTMANAGLFRKTGGPGAATLGLVFNNTGTVEVQSGGLTFQSIYTQTAGLTFLNGGNITNTVPLRIQGGVLAGTNFITGSVTNNGALSPGASPGLLTISGNYTEGTNARLQIELGGITPGSGHDQLSIGGSAALAGTLELSYWNGFTPSPGNIFTVLVCNARSGAFSSIQSPAGGLATIYTASAVLVEPGNVAPVAHITASPVPIACRTFLVSGSATDSDGTVTNLTLLLDTNILVSVPGASAQVTVSHDFPGDIILTALATDNQGAIGTTNLMITIGTLPLLVLDPIGFQTNRAFKLCMAGEAGTNYQMLVSDNLGATNWAVLGVMQNTNGIWRYTDSTATNSARRYYRAQQTP